MAARDPALAGRILGQFFDPGQGLDERYRFNNTAISLFGQIDFAVTDRLTLTGGLNYTHDKKRFSANVASDDAFSALDFNNPTYAPFRNQLIVAGALQQAGVNPFDSAAVQAFATNPATAPIYQGIVAFADANQSNPGFNPLNQLTPRTFLSSH